MLGGSAHGSCPAVSSLSSAGRSGLVAVQRRTILTGGLPSWATQKPSSAPASTPAPAPTPSSTPVPSSDGLLPHELAAKAKLARPQPIPAATPDDGPQPHERAAKEKLVRPPQPPPASAGDGLLPHERAAKERLAAARQAQEQNDRGLLNERVAMERPQAPQRGMPNQDGQSLQGLQGRQPWQRANGRQPYDSATARQAAQQGNVQDQNGQPEGPSVIYSKKRRRFYPFTPDEPGQDAPRRSVNLSVPDQSSEPPRQGSPTQRPSRPSPGFRRLDLSQPDPTLDQPREGQSTQRPSSPSTGWRRLDLKSPDQPSKQTESSSKFEPAPSQQPNTSADSFAVLDGLSLNESYSKPKPPAPQRPQVRSAPSWSQERTPSTAPGGTPKWAQGATPAWAKGGEPGVVRFVGVESKADTEGFSEWSLLRKRQKRMPHIDFSRPLDPTQPPPLPPNYATLVQSPEEQWKVLEERIIESEMQANAAADAAAKASSNAWDWAEDHIKKIGRASCRERV